MTQHVDDHKTIFFFEDDRLDADRIKNILERPPVKPDDPVLKVFHYERAWDALKMISQWSSRLPDVALLDVGQDDYADAGIDICVEIRKLWPSVPVMFLSERYKVEDRLRGRKVGAVTYMPKAPLYDNEPGCEQEILLAVYALLGIVVVDPDPDKYSSGSLEVDVDAYEVRWRGKKLRLSASEIGIVDELAKPKHAGKTRRHASLADAGGMSGKPLNQSQLRINVKQRIRLIRQAFESVDEGFKAAWKERRHGIIAVDQVGYYWMPDGDQSEDRSGLMMEDGVGAESNG